MLSRKGINAIHASTYNLWFERRLYFSGFQLDPVNPSEERMGLDLLLRVITHSQPLGGVPYHQGLAEVLGLLAHGLGIADSVVGDGGKQFLLIISIKWRLPN